MCNYNPDTTYFRISHTDNKICMKKKISRNAADESETNDNGEENKIIPEQELVSSFIN